MKTFRAFFLSALFICPAESHSQEPPKLQQLIDLALLHNRALSSTLFTDEGRDVEIEKTLIYYNYDENNLPPVGSALNVWGIQQKMHFPTIYLCQEKAGEAEAQMNVKQEELHRMKVTQDVCRQYYTLMYAQQLDSVYASLDSLYAVAPDAGTEREEATLRRRQVQLLLLSAETSLKLAVQAEIPFSLEHLPRRKAAAITASLEDHPGLEYFSRAERTSALKTKVQQQFLLPDLQLEYFYGRNGNPNSPGYNGVQLGLAIPLFYGIQKENVETAREQEEQVRLRAEQYAFSLRTRLEQLKSQLAYYEEALAYYEKELARVRASDEYGDLSSLRQEKQLEIRYLDALQGYNQTRIEANYPAY